MKPKDALVVLYYNKSRLTKSCVTSILQAGYPAEQVFCFDNGSKPEVFAELQKAFPRVQHYRTEQNRGFSGGFNKALEPVFADGVSSVLFCTNDTVVYPSALENCRQTARQTGAGIIAPCITYLSRPAEIDSSGGYFDPTGCTLHHYRKRDLPVLLEPGKDYIPGTALWIHRDAFKALGGTDESYFTYWEDVDLSFRAHRENIPQARCYEAKIAHGVGQTCHKKPLYTTFYFQRNRVRFCKRYLSGADLERGLGIIREELLRAGDRWQEKGDRKRLNYLEQILAEIDDEAAG
ncbi:MAG: glycosyltransferase family 2 protein [Candidatus Aminicenantes bacterium]|nr:glycosyltransferase family 2 protein [Candidatus Aminicenantes bacterium]